MKKHLALAFLLLGLLCAAGYAFNTDNGRIDGLFIVSFVLTSVGAVLSSHLLYEEEEDE